MQNHALLAPNAGMVYDYPAYCQHSIRRIALIGIDNNSVSRGIPIHAKIEGLADIAQLKIIVAADIIGNKLHFLAIQIDTRKKFP